MICDNPYPSQSCVAVPNQRFMDSLARPGAGLRTVETLFKPDNDGRGMVKPRHVKKNSTHYVWSHFRTVSGMTFYYYITLCNATEF
jgi:hypothetical protein